MTAFQTYLVPIEARASEIVAQATPAGGPSEEPQRRSHPMMPKSGNQGESRGPLTNVWSVLEAALSDWMACCVAKLQDLRGNPDCTGPRGSRDGWLVAHESCFQAAFVVPSSLEKTGADHIGGAYSKLKRFLEAYVAPIEAQAKSRPPLTQEQSKLLRETQGDLLGETGMTELESTYISEMNYFLEDVRTFFNVWPNQSKPAQLHPAAGHTEASIQWPWPVIV